DAATAAIDTQYLVGKALLVSPVLAPGATSVSAYFPSGAAWYDLATGAQVQSGGQVTLAAPLDTVPIHVRGGSIVTMQSAAMTTTSARKTPFSLLVAFQGTDVAQDDLYLDSGDSINPVEAGAFTLMQFQAKQSSSGSIVLSATVASAGYTGPETQL
ncbi:hypothetical protein As57867_007604, partial [Aphanomyces stellatus]